MALNTSRFEQLMTRTWELLTELHAFEREYDALGGAAGLTDEMFEGTDYTREEFVAACQFAAGATGLVVVKASQKPEEQAAAGQRAALLVKVKQ